MESYDFFSLPEVARAIKQEWFIPLNLLNVNRFLKNQFASPGNGYFTYI